MTALRHERSEGQVLLEVEDACKTFGGLRAVHGVSLQVQAGEIVGLIGPNGAGKSTLVDLMAGVTRLDSGTVTLLGEDVTTRSAPDRATRGLIRTFQSTRTFPLMSATDVVMSGLTATADDSFVRWLTRPRKARRERRRLYGRAREHLRALDLTDVLGPTPVGVLAPGVNRLLGFAVAVAAEPRVLVLDEPGAGLSANERELLSERVTQAAARGLGVLVIEHDVGFIMRTCHRVVALDHGIVIAQGSPAEVRANAAVRQAYLGDVDDVDA